MNIIGMDIGGANIKLATNNGESKSIPFPMWQRHRELSTELAGALHELPAFDAIALTMTAELADCFETKAQGVDYILSAAQEAAQGKPIHVWQTGAEFVSPETAREIPLMVAAANWHALATWCGRIAPIGRAVLIDIGSTTTDFIPLLDGTPVPRGFTDIERLLSSELVYMGVGRTPLFSLVRSVPFGDEWCPLAAELFSTTLDVYLLLGKIAPAESTNTANGQPATKEHAHNRIARSLCCDRTELSLRQVEDIAEFIANVQSDRLSGSLKRMLGNFISEGGNAEIKNVIISGAGSFLARQLIERESQLSESVVTDLSGTWDSIQSECACATSVAHLASERIF